MSPFLSALFIFAPFAAAAKEGNLAAALIQASHLRYRADSRSFLFRVQALPGQGSGVQILSALDTNKDGHVDPSEVTAFAVAQGVDATAAASEFSVLDVNHDGSLDASEVESALGDAGASSGLATPASQPAFQPAVVDTVAQAPVAQFAQPAVVLPAAVETASAQPVQTQVLAAGPVEVDSSVSMAQRQDTVVAEKHTTAKQSAEELVADLAEERKAEGEAEALERKVAELRSNASNLAMSTKQRAMKASDKAATRKANELAKQIKDLEDKAEDAEAKAAAIRARSNAEYQSAKDLVEVAHTNLQ